MKKYEHIGTTSTDLSVIDEYKIPPFQVNWNYSVDYFSDEILSVLHENVAVSQTAAIARVIRRKDDMSLFAFRILDTDGIEIHGEHAKNCPEYNKIYNDLVENKSRCKNDFCLE